MSYTPVDVVQVFAWGRRVGVLAAGRRRGAYDFEYDPAWVRTGVELAPVLMPRRLRPFSFADLPRETYSGLPPMIADSLPDAFGNSLIDAWMAEQGIPHDRVTALDRLAYLGNRGMGALEYVPDVQPGAQRPSALDMNDLVLAARAAVHGTLTTERAAQHALQQIIDVGTSAGGARAKAIINLNTVTGEITSGHIAPGPDAEPWLLKFDGVGIDEQLGETSEYGRIEQAYAQMARAAGVEMAPTRLLEEHGRAHFMTRRFDREGTRRLHLQSLTGLAAVDFRASGANSYAQVFTTIDELGLPADQLRHTRTEIWRRMAFNVAASNNDDHAKNIGFLADEQGIWRLSPAYDLTFAYNPRGQWTNQHQLAINGRFRDITREDLLAVADQFEVQHVKQTREAIAAALDSWSEFATAAGVSPATRDRIGGMMHPEVL